MVKLFLSLMILVVLFTSCRKGSLPIEDSAHVFILRGEAAGEDTTTTPRMLYTDMGYMNNDFFKAGVISATWEGTDVIEFCFAQPSGNPTLYRRATSLPVSPISGTSRCTFQVTIPTTANGSIPGIDITKPFNVYAVTGNSNISYISAATTANPTLPRYVNLQYNTIGLKASLPGSTGLRNSILQVASKIGVISTASPTNISLNFKQIGSLLAFAVKNYRTNLDLTIYDFSISSATNNNWLYDLSSGSSRWDLVSNAMEPGSTTTNELMFFDWFNTAAPNPITVAAASGTTYNTGTVYQWFIPTTTAPNNLSINITRGTATGGYTSIPTANGNTIDNPGVLRGGYRYYINRRYMQDVNNGNIWSLFKP